MKTAVQAVNVTSEVKIVHEVHGVGHGGYDCDAGASNWMQGWPLGWAVADLLKLGLDASANATQVTQEEGLLLRSWWQPVLREVPLPC